LGECTGSEETVDQGGEQLVHEKSPSFSFQSNTLLDLQLQRGPSAP
jgi:hypothetical protein